MSTLCPKCLGMIRMCTHLQTVSKRALVVRLTLNIRELSAVVYLLSRLKSDDVVLRSLEHLSLPTKPLNGQSKVSTVSVCGKSFQQLPIESLSNAIQEYAVVSDLLQCLQGNQGVYIKPLPLSNRYAVRCFKVDEKMTPALLDTVNKILPVCSDYSTVARFIGEKSTFEHGMVNQALAGAMRGLLKDYLILLCQLEYQYKIGHLGIVKLHFFLQETATAFNQLTRLVNNINTGQCSGGAVLSVLYDSLRSVKRFFLLDQGDFIVHFMDAATAELRKNSETISQLRLSSLLELALRTSTANSDPFKDNLSVVIFQFDLISQILMVLRAGSEDEPYLLPIQDKNLSGLEAFCLDYRVGWPIDLVLNRQVMDRYQMLFRHILYCKHVERLLCNSWILGKLARKCDNLMTTWFTTAFLLAQRMLIFIQHFQYYMSVEIIEPAWDSFFKRVDKVSNLDLLLDSHLHFLEVCMDDCLLASPDLLSLVGKLSVACVTFANFIQHLTFSITGVNLSSPGDNDQCIIYLSRHGNDMERPFLHDPTPSSSLSRTKNDLKYAPRESTTSSVESMMTKVTREEFGRMSLSDDMAKTVTNFDTNFNRMLVELLEKIKQYAKHHSKLLSLVSRLDFNEFYTEFAMQYDQSERSPESPGDHEPSLDKDTLVEHKSVPQTNSGSDNEDYI
ncbi:putative gamma-tubulin complex component 2 (gcp-2) [Schistosoma mansoni]|uniref:putative gamma-tubulin complex component 2 (gcp-2) n=1 Tax=Schistosoma mansoni TaxID=6183 RepID=UPI00022DCAAB|nr:putative gamma-tubulin complex component 2 (gcp-2) [Schistosoma mansoni]|eukprot:XP_018654123.1 putative gamma-tubulin complex component 2 (gcp-2) [Schistosoma mansoni]